MDLDSKDKRELKNASTYRGPGILASFGICCFRDCTMIFTSLTNIYSSEPGIFSPCSVLRYRG